MKLTLQIAGVFLAVLISGCSPKLEITDRCEVEILTPPAEKVKPTQPPSSKIQSVLEASQETEKVASFPKVFFPETSHDFGMVEPGTKLT
ncbi:MAG: hypothetical protein MJB12_15715, partial [Firmicutes bacterium]|nr:hypothetical protein [Bacillota bacterium]